MIQILKLTIILNHIYDRGGMSAISPLHILLFNNSIIIKFCCKFYSR